MLFMHLRIYYQLCSCILAYLIIKVHREFLYLSQREWVSVWVCACDQWWCNRFRTTEPVCFSCDYFLFFHFIPKCLKYGKPGLSAARSAESNYTAEKPELNRPVTSNYKHLPTRIMSQGAHKIIIPNHCLKKYNVYIVAINPFFFFFYRHSFSLIFSSFIPTK